MSLGEVVDATYGPYRLRISPEKVAEFVAATGDEPDRWLDHAPPSYAGGLLFVAAPHFLNDPRVRPHTGVLVHVDQSFTWYAPLTVGAPITITARVDKVRERAGRFFVTFLAEVTLDGAEPLVESVSTFLMGEGSGATSGDSRHELPVWKRELNDLPLPRPWPGIGGVSELAKSASRADLVRYAGASGDFNPIHFDHDAAREAGLPGIVVHGLLMAAWATQAVTSVNALPDPIAHAKFRFRNPLYPGTQAAVTARVKDVAQDGDDARVSVKLQCGGDDLVTVSCVVRLSG